MSGARILQTEDRSNVGMAQRGEDLRFALKPRQAFGVACKAFGNDFQRDISFQLRIPRAVHLAHSARPDGGQDLK